MYAPRLIGGPAKGRRILGKAASPPAVRDFRGTARDRMRLGENAASSRSGPTGAVKVLNKGGFMYRKIMVPVDLAHTEKIEKALNSASDLAKHYGVPVCYVSVTSTAPGPVAHTPQEYKQKLHEFAAKQSEIHGQKIEAFVYTSHDPAVDLDDTLLKAIHESGSDLVVMATHVPGIPEHIFASNGGAVASHADVSVFLVR